MKRHPAAMKNKGFTLVEMVISLFILAFSLLGFVGALSGSIDVNMRNELRNTGVSKVSHLGRTLLAIDFDSDALAEGTCLIDYEDAYTPKCGEVYISDYEMFPKPVIQVRGTTVYFTYTWTVTDLSNTLKQIEIQLDYKYRGASAPSYNTVIYKRKETA